VPVTETEIAPAAAETHPRSWLRGLGEIIVIVAGAFVLALVLQAFVVKSYVIPTPSMVPTLMLGDRVMVNRFIFRFTEPKRGDIIVFKTALRKDPLIKRVIGVGGDRIAVHDGSLYLNGEPQVEPQLNDKVISGEFKEITVPPGEFFMMGDNRNESADSRVFGPIKRNVILGRAFLRFWPLNRLHWL
jgi:signal peptidase I